MSLALISNTGVNMNHNATIHDIRNHLNTISMNAELGKLTVEQKKDPEKLIKILDVILRECQQCSHQLTELKADITGARPPNSAAEK